MSAINYERGGCQYNFKKYLLESGYPRELIENEVNKFRSAIHNNTKTIAEV